MNEAGFAPPDQNHDDGDFILHTNQVDDSSNGTYEEEAILRKANSSKMGYTSKKNISSAQKLLKNIHGSWMKIIQLTNDVTSLLPGDGSDSSF